jgi:hypothetical protein
MCEGMFGLFRTEDAQAYQVYIASGEAEILRGSPSMVTVPEIAESTFQNMRDGHDKCTRFPKDELDIDIDDASYVALFHARYPGQAAKQHWQHDELDQLTDGLGDAKLGACQGHIEMMDLMTGLEGL